MRLTELTGHPVLSRSDARELGRLDNVVIDPNEHRISAYRLSGGRWVVPADGPGRIGHDAVMVDDPTDIREAQTDIERRAVDRDVQIIGARVLTDRGNEIGTVTDLEFDADSGHIEALSVGSERISGDDLLGVGTYAVVVLDPYQDDQRR